MPDIFFPKVVIIGVGLIGGSFALALKKSGAVGEVVGIGRSRENLERAVTLGVVDDFSLDPAEGVRGADLVFLATPVLAMPRVVGKIVPHMKSGSVLTDAGSVKGEVIRELDPLIPGHLRFVPGHPLAGTEKTGAEAAFANLYQDRLCILTPTSRTDSKGLALVRKAWEAVGSRVVLMDAEKHDRILAAVSHLPHMLASSLVNLVGSYDRYDENLFDFAADGFRDFTRIASSDPIMWRDIAVANRDALIEMMENFETLFAGLKTHVRHGDGEALCRFFRRSKKRRDDLAARDDS